MEKQELITAVKEQLEAFKANLPNYASPDDVTAVKEQLEAQMKDLNLKDDIKKLNDILKEQGEKLTKMQAASVAGQSKSITDYIREKAEDLLRIKDGGHGSVAFRINKGDVLRSNVTDSTMAMRLTDVGQIGAPATVIAPLFRQGRVGANSNGVIRYIDQNSIVRGAGMVAEGGQKPESAITWIEKTLPLEKIADTIPVSREALADVDFISGEIDRLLRVNLSLKEDEQVWDGDGVAPNLKGIYTTAPAYTVPNIGLSAPNIYDLILKMQEAITATKGTKYSPNYVVMNHADVNAMRLTKDTTGNYIIPPFAGSDNVAGIRIVASNQVTQNTMLVGDFNYGTLYSLEDVSIEVGYINDQFTHNMVTILAEKREALLVRSADESGFLKVTDIAAALTALGT